MQFRFEMSILNQTWSFSKQNQQSAFSTPNTFFLITVSLTTGLGVCTIKTKLVKVDKNVNFCPKFGDSTACF